MPAAARPDYLASNGPRGIGFRRKRRRSLPPRPPQATGAAMRDLDPNGVAADQGGRGVHQVVDRCRGGRLMSRARSHGEDHWRENDAAPGSGRSRNEAYQRACRQRGPERRLPWRRDASRRPSYRGPRHPQRGKNEDRADNRIIHPLRQLDRATKHRERKAQHRKRIDVAPRQSTGLHEPGGPDSSHHHIQGERGCFHGQRRKTE